MGANNRCAEHFLTFVSGLDCVVCMHKELTAERAKVAELTALLDAAHKNVEELAAVIFTRNTDAEAKAARLREAVEKAHSDLSVIILGDHVRNSTMIRSAMRVLEHALLAALQEKHDADS